MAQTYPQASYEIIIVDNNSTDDSLTIARQFKNVRQFQEKHIQSSYAARNVGIKEARGEFIAFTDADCVPDAQWLECLMSSFDKDPSLVGVGGEVKPYQPKTIVQLYQAHNNVLSPKYLAATELGVMPPTCNVMYRAMVFQLVGGFNSNLISRGDNDLAFRILQQMPGKIIFNWSAIVFHQHRVGLRELWKQYYRYGTGRRHWNDLGHLLTSEELKIESFGLYVVVGFLIALVKTILSFINCLRGISRYYEILFPWLEWWEGMALRLGFKRAKRLKSKRLLILFPSWEKGGAEIATLKITQSLILKEWDVHIGFERTPGLESLVKDFTALKSNYHHCHIAEKQQGEGLLHQLRVCWETFQIIEKVKPDIVKIILSWPTFGFGIRFTCALLNLPTLVVFQYMTTSMYIHPIKKKIYQWMLNRRQFLVAVSKNNQAHLSQVFSINPEKIQCVYNSTKIAANDSNQKMTDRLAVEKEFNLYSQHKILLTIANFYPNKGHEDLLKVIPRIVHEFPDTIFLWAGNLFSQKEYFESKIKDKDLGKNLRLIGFRQDIPKLLNAANIFVFPSHSEGFSLALLEAMARQLPVIATDIESNLEILKDKKNAVCYSNKDCEGLYLAIRWALINPQAMLELAKQGFNDVQAFSDQKCEEKYDSILNDLLRKN